MRNAIILLEYSLSFRGKFYWSSNEMRIQLKIIKNVFLCILIIIFLFTFLTSVQRKLVSFWIIFKWIKTRENNVSYNRYINFHFAIKIIICFQHLYILKKLRKKLCRISLLIFMITNLQIISTIIYGWITV